MMSEKITQPPAREVALSLHKLSPSEVYEALGSSESGLSNHEAETRIKKYGKNLLEEKKGTPLLVKFLSNFTH